MRWPCLQLLSRFFALLCLLGMSPVPLLAADAPMPPRQAAEFFEKSVRPLLVENCFQCHSSRKHKGSLRLDSRQALLNGGETGPAIVPGHPEQSLLLKALHYKDDLKMPPKGQLRPEQIATLASWIKQGAPWPDNAREVRPIVATSNFKITAKEKAFWSFQPIANPPVPAVRTGNWALGYRSLRPCQAGRKAPGAGGPG